MKSNTIKKVRYTGYSFLELLIVISIIGIITVMSIEAYQKMNVSYLLSSDAQHLIESAHTARTKTLAREDQKKYGLKVSTSSMTLFEGTSYDIDNSSNVLIPFSPSVNLSASTTNGTVFIFDPLTGMVNSEGTLTLFSTKSDSFLIIDVFSSGIFKRR